ncbi:MAG: hypothetical protein H6968_18295 [Chromatiaceae bacterium]|nr:hypothetical protein [Chromatiaceae bacterium]
MSRQAQLYAVVFFFLQITLLFSVSPTAKSEISTAVSSVFTGMQHGEYTEEYRMDWSRLPLGNVKGKTDFRDTEFIDVVGEYARRSYINKKIVEIKDVAYRVKWNSPSRKYSTSVIHIRGADRVVIENVAIISLDADYRTYSSIFIEDSREVIIKNVYIAGAAAGYQIRVEGSENVLIDGAEITGYNYSGKGVRAGGGIWINNGPTYSPNPKEPKWAVVQNCYLHDYLDADNFRNHDAINVQTPQNGLIFNCFIENWGKDGQIGDGAIDISYRNKDRKNGRFRIERNVIRNCFVTKTPGEGAESNTVVWANNLYIDTEIGDYHSGWMNSHIHNSYMFTKPEHKRLYKLWGVGDEGRIVFQNNMVAAASPLWAVFWENSSGVEDNYGLIQSDHNTFFMEQPYFWLGGKRKKIKQLNQWRSHNKDINSALISGRMCNLDQESMQIDTNCLLRGSGSPVYLDGSQQVMQVNKDFWGRTRTEAPTPGAFE